MRSTAIKFYNSTPWGQVSFLKKQMNIILNGTPRPQAHDLYPGSASGYIVPRFPWGFDQLRELAMSSDIISIIHTALKKEMFRNGIDLIPGEDTDETITTSDETISVDDSEEVKRKALIFLERINKNAQTVRDISEEAEDDLNIYDDAYWMFVKEYTFKPNGEIADFELKEVMRIDPRFMGLVQNKFDLPGHDDHGKPMLVCPNHRETALPGIEVCPEPDCGKKCYKAYYFHNYGGTRIHYYETEVEHQQRYRPSKRYGFPPIMTLWHKIRTLYFMDKYMMELYVGQRPPKAGLFFRTMNQETIEKAWEKVKERATEDPHLPIVMPIPTAGVGGDKGKFVEFIDFMKPLSEMQYTEARDEMRRQIGAFYGVEPIFQGDMSNSGGLNNEGLQVTVTNRAIEGGQGKNYNEGFYKRLIREMKMPGWTLRLNPSEEQDEMAKIERLKANLEAGKMALDVGLQVEFQEDTGEVVVKSGDLEKQQFDFGGSPFGQNDPEAADKPSGTPDKNKSIKKAATRPSFTKLDKAIKEEIDKFIKRFNRKPSQQELNEAIQKIGLRLQNEMKDGAEALFKKSYTTEMEKIGSDLGLNFTFDQVDQFAVHALKNQAVLSQAFKGLTDELTEKLHDVFTEAYTDPEGLSVAKITQQVKDAVDVSDFRAETIARTESGKIAAAARRNSYKKADPDDEFRYRHVGPNDNRTTDTSKRIKSRTQKGVSWDEYVQIVKEESAKDFPEWSVDESFPLSHYNTRHSFVRTQ